MVFVAGGMTYSEMREAYSLSKSLNKEVIIGKANHIIDCDVSAANVYRFHAYAHTS